MTEPRIRPDVPPGWLRWACVVPAAMAGGLAVQLVVGMVGRCAVAMWGRPDESVLVHLLDLAFHAPPPMAFVLAGAATAPRGRVATAAGLAAAGVALSLMVHVVGQAHPGTTNLAHLAIESAGAVLGLGCIVVSGRTHGP